MELVQAGKFGFSTPDLDRNKLDTRMCLARKARDREKCLSNSTEGRQLFCFFEFLNLSRHQKCEDYYT